MKNKWKHIFVCATVSVMFLSFILNFACPAYAYASDGEDYITISVDAVDNNSDLKYALDSDDPTAFTSSNEFTVPAGTSHTIYVKDAAGNVTSQQYEAQMSSESTGYDDHYRDGDDDEDTQQINIDLELGQKNAVEESLSTSDTEGKSGTASVTNRTITDGSIDSEKVFYTFMTKEGAELYLVVDQGSGADNVYLLDTVSLTDLRVLADGYGSSSGVTSDDRNEENLLSILAEEEKADDDLEKSEMSESKKSSYGNPLLIILVVGIGVGIYYYLKIYRNKKDEAMDAMDAMDMDEFEAEEDEEEEVEFDYDEAEKERYLEALLNEENDDTDDLLDADPDDYAASHTEIETQETDPFDEDAEDADYDVDIF